MTKSQDLGVVSKTCIFIDFFLETLAIVSLQDHAYVGAHFYRFCVLLLGSFLDLFKKLLQKINNLFMIALDNWTFGNFQN